MITIREEKTYKVQSGKFLNNHLRPFSKGLLSQSKIEELFYLVNYFLTKCSAHRKCLRELVQGRNSLKFSKSVADAVRRWKTAQKWQLAIVGKLEI